MRRCKYYDEDGDAWDKSCGYSKENRCRYFNPKFYCPVFNEMKARRENTIFNKIRKFFIFGDE
jgi:hypothetical protein